VLDRLQLEFTLMEYADPTLFFTAFYKQCQAAGFSLKKEYTDLKELVDHMHEHFDRVHRMKAMDSIIFIFCNNENFDNDEGEKDN